MGAETSRTGFSDNMRVVPNLWDDRSYLGISKLRYALVLCETSPGRKKLETVKMNQGSSNSIGYATAISTCNNCPLRMSEDCSGLTLTGKINRLNAFTNVPVATPVEKPRSPFSFIGFKSLDERLSLLFYKWGLNEPIHEIVPSSKVLRPDQSLVIENLYKNALCHEIFYPRVELKYDRFLSDKA